MKTSESTTLVAPTPPDTDTNLSENEGDDEEITRIAVMDRQNRKFTFNIIPNEPDGNCMFRALSQALFLHEGLYTKCRKDVVDYIIHDLNWADFYHHIRGQHEHLLLENLTKNKKLTNKTKASEVVVVPSLDDPVGESQQNSSNNTSRMSETVNDNPEEWKAAYKSYMLQDRTYGTLQELLAASDVFQFNLFVVRQISPLFFNIQDFKDFIWDTTCHFLFTGFSADDGHFEYLEPIKLQQNGPEKPILLVRGYYKMMDEEDTEYNNCVIIKEYFGTVPVFDENQEFQDGEVPTLEAVSKTESKGTVGASLDENSSAKINISEGLDINANVIAENIPASAEAKPKPKIERKRQNMRNPSTTDDDSSDFYQLSTGAETRKKHFHHRSKVHPYHQENLADRMQLLPTGSKVPKEQKWKRRIYSVCCACFPKSP